MINNDDHWDGWNSQHVNEYEFDESNEIALIYKLSALTEKLGTRLQASLNSQKIPEEIAQEIKHLRQEYDRLENYRQATINFYRDKMGEEVPEALLKPRVQSNLFRPSRPQAESPPTATSNASSGSSSRRTSEGKPHSSSKSKINVLHRTDKEKANQPATTPHSSPLGATNTTGSNASNTNLSPSSLTPTNSGKFISPRSTGARPPPNDNHSSPSSPKLSPSQTPPAPVLHVPLITPLDLLGVGHSAHNSPCPSRDSSRPSSPHHTPPLSPVSMHREEARQALSATALASSLHISGLTNNNNSNNSSSNNGASDSPRSEKAKNIKFNLSSPRSPRTTSLSRPIGTGGLCVAGLTTEEMDNLTMPRGSSQQAVNSPMTSLSHAPSPLTQSPGLTTPTNQPNQSMPPSSPLPPLPAITAPAPEPALPSPTWRREVSSDDDGYHNHSHSESSSEFQKGPAAFPIAPPKASANSRRRPSNSAQPTARSSDPDATAEQAAREDEAGEKSLQVSPSDDSPQSQPPSVHVSAHGVESSHPDFDNPQTRELREKLLHQILSHSQLQHQHLRPVQPAVTTANNNNNSSSDQQLTSGDGATTVTRRTSSPLDASNKVSRVTQPSRRLRVESCGPRERSSIIPSSDEARERNKIAQPGSLNLSAPEVASAQRAYPISEPPSPNNRHRMRSKSKDNQLHNEIINFRKKNNTNNTNTLTASNDASSNANSGSSITEEQ